MEAICILAIQMICNMIMSTRSYIVLRIRAVIEIKTSIIKKTFMIEHKLHRTCNKSKN